MCLCIYRLSAVSHLSLIRRRPIVSLYILCWSVIYLHSTLRVVFFSFFFILSASIHQLSPSRMDKLQPLYSNDEVNSPKIPLRNSFLVYNFLSSYLLILFFEHKYEHTAEHMECTQTFVLILCIQIFVLQQKVWTRKIKIWNLKGGIPDRGAKL